MTRRTFRSATGRENAKHRRLAPPTNPHVSQTHASPSELGQSPSAYYLQQVPALAAERQEEISVEKKRLNEKETKLSEKEANLSEKETKLDTEKKQLLNEKKQLLNEKKQLLNEKKTLQDNEDRISLELRTARVNEQHHLIPLLQEHLQQVTQRRTEKQNEINAIQNQLHTLYLQCLEVEKKAVEVQKEAVEVQKQQTSVQNMIEQVTQAKTSPTYVKSKKLSDFANSLKNAELEDKESGVAILKLPDGDLIPMDATIPHIVVTRRHSRKVCDEVVRTALSASPGTRLVLNGPPGIGKSWHINYVLRIFLQHGQKVLVASRKNKMYTKFVPKDDGTYEAFVCEFEGIQPTIDVNEEFIVIVDPTERANDVDFVKGVLILFASTNSKHYYNWDKDGMTRFFMPMASVQELQVGKKYYFRGRITDETIALRFKQVGGAPRYIFEDVNFRDRKSMMDRQYTELGRRTIKLLLDGGTPTNDVEDRKHSLSTLFLKYEVKGNDGEDCDYTQATVEFVSHYAKVKLLKYVIDVAYDAIVSNTNASMATYYGASFEDITCTHLLLGGTFKRRQVDDEAASDNFVLSTAKVEYVESSKKMLSLITLAKESKTKKKRMLYIPPKNFPVFDFVDSNSNFYQATINCRHQLSFNKLQELVDVAGRLDLIWCVPEKLAFAPPKLTTSLSGKVTQFVMKIPEKLQTNERYRISSLSEKASLEDPENREARL